MPRYDIRGAFVGGQCASVLRIRLIVAAYSGREPAVWPTGLRPVYKKHVNVLDI